MQDVENPEVIRKVRVRAGELSNILDHGLGQDLMAQPKEFAIGVRHWLEQSKSDDVNLKELVFGTGEVAGLLLESIDSYCLADELDRLIYRDMVVNHTRQLLSLWESLLEVLQGPPESELWESEEFTRFKQELDYLQQDGGRESVAQLQAFASQIAELFDPTGGSTEEVTADIRLDNALNEVLVAATWLLIACEDYSGSGESRCLVVEAAQSLSQVWENYMLVGTAGAVRALRRCQLRCSSTYILSTSRPLLAAA